MSDLPAISEALKSESPRLRDRVLAGIAKLEGLNDLVAVNALQRDGSRLHNKAKAVYKKMGLDVAEDENITNVLGDVTLSQDESGRRSGLSPVAAGLIAAAAAAAGALGSRFLPPPGDTDSPPAAVQPADTEQYGIRLMPQ